MRTWQLSVPVKNKPFISESVTVVEKYIYDDAVEALTIIKGELGDLIIKENKRYGKSSSERKQIFTRILYLIGDIGKCRCSSQTTNKERE